MNGHWRAESDRAAAPRDEGLNELGQAPPPYVAKGEVAAGALVVEEPQIPLRTLARDEGNRDSVKPPEYNVVVQESQAGGTHGDQERPITPLPVADTLRIQESSRRQ